MIIILIFCFLILIINYLIKILASKMPLTYIEKMTNKQNNNNNPPHDSMNILDTINTSDTSISSDNNNNELYSQVVNLIGNNTNHITRVGTSLDSLSKRAEEIYDKLNSTHNVSSNNNQMMQHSSTQSGQFIKPPPPVTNCKEGFSQSEDLLEKQTKNEYALTQLGNKIIAINNKTTQITNKLNANKQT